jgi:hypothetical protein
MYFIVCPLSLVCSDVFEIKIDNKKHVSGSLVLIENS